MRKLRALWVRVFGMLRPGHADDEFRAELESHLAMHIDSEIRAGVSPEEARRQALIRLGGAEQVRQLHRERRILSSLENLVRDTRYSLRALVKHPGVTAIAMLSIALGIGANGTIFSMVSRFVLRPAPVGDPSTLLTLSTMQKGDRCCNKFPFPLFENVRDDAHSFSGVAAYYDQIPASIGGSGEPERVWGQGVTANFFDVLELPMVLGRGFAKNDEAAPVVVLSETLWRRRFNADPSIAGKSVLLSGRNFTVVGIAPAAFHGAEQILYAQFWVPLGITAHLVPNLPPRDSREYHWLAVEARIRPGVSHSAVDAELKTLAARYERAYPATDKDSTFYEEQAGSLPPNIKSVVVVFLSGLMGIVLLVLTIAGANVANLLFAQAVARQKEMAVRLALGATRNRLRRQFLFESTLLALSGAVVGLLLSLWATRALSTLRLPAPVPLDLQIGIDWRVISFTFVLTFVCGALLGLGPAWAASRPFLVNALKGEDPLARAGRRFSLRNVLLVAQIAMSVVLLSATILFLRSLQNAAAINIGIQPRGLMVLSIDPRVHGYSADRTIVFLNQLEERARALPGVVSAVVTDVPPLTGGNRSEGFTVAGESGKDAGMTYAELYMVTPGYFGTIGTPLLAGHDFGSETADGLKTAIINKEFAHRLFPHVNPIGQRVKGGDVTYEIIGVAGNAKSRSVGEADRAILYRPLVQSVAGDPSLMGYTLVVKAAGNPAALFEPVRRQVYALDPAMAIFNEETMDEHVRTAFVLPRVAAMLFGIFGSIGIVLTAIGLYGVMSYSVTRRTREIGIRMAMGARPGTVERFVLRQGLVLTLIAIALGWPAAWMLAKMARSFLYGIQPHDALTFALVPPFLITIALAACWIPARRAASVDPMKALRTE
ncbi:MAG TPA: ABC transporter permease [Terracidiphilus sp.]|nr:ABC transporter permease [Terracidiphilus sp.]